MPIKVLRTEPETSSQNPQDGGDDVKKNIPQVKVTIDSKK